MVDALDEDHHAGALGHQVLLLPAQVHVPRRLARDDGHHRVLPQGLLFIVVGLGWVGERVVDGEGVPWGECGWLC